MKSLEILNKFFKSMENIQLEEQNRNYEGLVFYDSNNNVCIRSRLARKTNKKDGYFVSFWTKNEQGNNEAYSYQNSPEYTAIVIDKQGLFLFPKEILLREEILKSESSKGKMGIRVYPPLCSQLNRNAERSQRWQCKYYHDIKKIDLD